MNTFQTLCCKFVERSQALGLKGKKRDDAALDFICGAATALELAKHPDAQHVATCAVLLVSTRGYLEVKRVADEALQAVMADLAKDRESAA